MIINILLVIFGLVFISSIIWNFAEQQDGGGLSTIALCVSCFLFTGILLTAVLSDTPSAIDVYRGKTALEITYRDSVAVDSVVVFKEK